jgi:signal transduction histidine kinase
MWFATAGLVLLILILTSYVAPIAGWFQLRFWPALFCFLPSFVFGVSAGLAEQRGELSLSRYGALILVGCGLLQFFFAALVALSRPPGSFILASLYVLTLAVHGYVNRAALKYPYMPLTALVFSGCALALSPDSQTLRTFAFVFPTAMSVMLLSGQAGVIEHADRKERDKLKQAILYRSLSERTEAHNQMSKRVMDLLSYNHDAGNTLSTVFMNAQLLGETLTQHAPSLPSSKQLLDQVSRLSQQLDVLKSMINRAHTLADEMPSIAPVALLEVLDDVAIDCRSLFPSALIEVQRPSNLAPIAVRVHDGATGLRRILENVLHNACQGNGIESARSIRVEIAGAGSTVSVRCIDDGPGFDTRQLGQPLEPFSSTKIDGHGLGLFSVDHLIRASGGQFSVSNGKDGGAVVNIELMIDQLD